MTTTSSYTYHDINLDALTARDLQDEIAPGATAYRITFYDQDGFQRSDFAEALYLPAEGRLGIAWGADATWADVSNVESGIAMWATDPDGWEAAN